MPRTALRRSGQHPRAVRLRHPDLRGEYRITPEWRLQARVANLLDADYETAEGYNQPGQAAYLTVRYRALRLRRGHVARVQQRRLP